MSENECAACGLPLRGVLVRRTTESGAREVVHAECFDDNQGVA